MKNANQLHVKNLVINYKGEEIKAGEILSIEEETLSDEFARQASVYGWIANLVAQAEYELSEAKLAADQEYATADEGWRENYIRMEKKFTEPVIRACILLDEVYIEAKTKEMAAANQLKLLKSLLDALKMKADMLISMGAHIRAEQGMLGMNIGETGKASRDIKAAIKGRRNQV